MSCNYIVLLMLKSYLAHLEMRVQGLEKLLGPTQDYHENEIKEVREGINDLLAKVHKDVSRKFDRIKKVIDRHAAVIDSLPTADKVTLVHSQLDELHTIAAQLDRIEKQLPALSNQNYIKVREDYQGLHLLNQSRELEVTVEGKIKGKEGQNKQLGSVRETHRQQIGDLLELNGQVINNLSAKLVALQNRRVKQHGV